MFEFPEMPDIVKETIEWLRAHESITSRDATVAADLKGYNSPESYVTVQATGGVVPNKFRVWAQRLDINAYAASKYEAYALCRAVITALYSMQGHTTDDTAVTRVVCDSLPSDLTDPINSDYRFVSDVTVYFRRN